MQKGLLENVACEQQNFKSAKERQKPTNNNHNNNTR